MSTTCSTILANKQNYFACLALPIEKITPSDVRRSYLKQALKSHPDKVSCVNASEAFQCLSVAFEALYDPDSQSQHLAELISQAQLSSKPKASSQTESKKRKRPKPSPSPSPSQSQSPSPSWTTNWANVEAELARREALEKAYISSKRSAFASKSILRLLVRSQKICRTLDEQAGCPPTFVNPLWASVAMREALKGATLPEGWSQRKVEEPSLTNFNNPKFVFRQVSSGLEQENHPEEEKELYLQKCRKAAGENDNPMEMPRLLLGELIEYLREEYAYEDLDEELADLDLELENAEKLSL